MGYKPMNVTVFYFCLGKPFDGWKLFLLGLLWSSLESWALLFVPPLMIAVSHLPVQMSSFLVS
jgi:hypothetical protein